MSSRNFKLSKIFFHSKLDIKGTLNASDRICFWVTNRPEFGTRHIRCIFSIGYVGRYYICTKSFKSNSNILLQGRIQDTKKKKKGGGHNTLFFWDRRQPRKSRKSQKSWWAGGGGGESDTFLCSDTIMFFFFFFFFFLGFKRGDTCTKKRGGGQM